jgi:hypothetical protein
METEKFCQSCSMPLNNSTLLGTEKDGSKNSTYCSYCYQNGAFTNANITLEGMQLLVSEQMKKMKMNDQLIQQTMTVLPTLSRWRHKKLAVK